MHVFSQITAGFGGSYGVAIGFSITAAIEIVYWVFIKPLGFPREDQCKYCTKHHYTSVTKRWITKCVQFCSIMAFLIFSGFRFYLVAYRYLNLPIPDEKKNQITSPNF